MAWLLSLIEHPILLVFMAMLILLIYYTVKYGD